MNFTKRQKMAFLYIKLRNDPRWAVQALIRIYERQTQDERLTSNTVARNGVGFSAWDAPALTPLAIKAKAGIIRLTPYELALAKNRMHKYRRQILELSNPETLHKAMEKYYAPRTEDGQGAEERPEEPGHPRRKSDGSGLHKEERETDRDREEQGLYHSCDGVQLSLWPETSDKDTFPLRT